MQLNPRVFFDRVRVLLYDKNGDFKLEIYRNRWFIGVLVLKIIIGTLLASNFLTKLFIPFVNYFVESGFHDPYQFFYSQNIWNAFPYPNLMLVILAIPRFVVSVVVSSDIWSVNWINLLVMRLPVLLADITIFTVLVRWLKNSQNKVLLWYWCSPILFYINYVHGQLDVIPMMLLFVFLYLFFKDEFRKAFIFLGLALATKTSMVIVLPFVLVYLLLNRMSYRKIIYYFMVALGLFGIINLPFLFSEGFRQLVFLNQEQAKIFDLSLVIGNGLQIYLVPLAYLGLLVKSLSYKRFNRDIFLMFLGFAFGILTLFIPPMQGWYYWVIPFFVYYYVKQDDAPTYIFVLLNVLYFVYFALVRNSDFFAVWQVISPRLTDHLTLYQFLQVIGMNSDYLVNFAFTLLQGSLLANILWIYRKGIENYTKLKINYQPFLVGVAGDSGSGKSILTELLVNKFGDENTLVVAGDDMHCWERGDVNWSKYTHLNPKANMLHAEMQNVLDLKEGRSIKRSFYDHASGKFTLPQELHAKKILVFQGLHTFYLNKMRELYDLKIFLQPDETLRSHWKVVRDMKERGYNKDKVLCQLRDRHEDSVRYISKQVDYADIVISFGTDKQITDLGVKDDYGVYLKVFFENTISVDSLLESLSSCEGIKYRHLYEGDRQVLEFRGQITVEQIDKIAYKLIPELWEVNKRDPRWDDGYNGIIQLFVAYYIFTKMKFEKRYGNR